jgi:hypothetical protein
MPFSGDYYTARNKFRELADALKLRQAAHPVDDTDLTIDVATTESNGSAATLIISSGLHGVEGFLGSAIQLQLMRQWLETDLPQNVRVVFVHSLNPFGFASVRRWNESNVDLNRNFMLPGEPYSGCAETYHRLQSLLNPETPPSRWDLFYLQAIGVVVRHGMSKVKQAIAEGQYEYPQGLFFGGNRLEQTALIVQQEFDNWLADSERVVHLDVHTGLGKYATYKLLIDYQLSDIQLSTLQNCFGVEQIEVSDAAKVAYAANGGWSRWCVAQKPSIDYTYLCAEFGTLGPIKILNRLRRENQAHFYCDPNDSRFARAKTDLKESFCPSDPRWRKAVLAQASIIVEQSLSMLSD